MCSLFRSEMHPFSYKPNQSDVETSLTRNVRISVTPIFGNPKTGMDCTAVLCLRGLIWCRSVVASCFAIFVAQNVALAKVVNLIGRSFAVQSTICRFRIGSLCYAENRSNANLNFCCEHIWVNQLVHLDFRKKWKLNFPMLTVSTWHWANVRHLNTQKVSQIFLPLSHITKTCTVAS